VVTVSGGIKEYLKQKMGLLAKRMHMIYDASGVSTDCLGELREILAGRHLRAPSEKQAEANA
jgi:hypothetical protein